MNQMELCECGCGQPVTKEGNRFISGHNSRVNHPKGMLGKISPKKINKVISTCQNCGNEIEHQRSVKRKFCNRKCLSEWMSKQKGDNCPNYQGGKEKFICEYCGKEFENHLSQLCNHKFCNKECYNKWQSINKIGENSSTWKGGLITKTCEICGNEFESAPSANHRFCCNACRAIWVGKQQQGKNHPMWNGGKIILVCKYCGNEFKSYRLNQKFCNNECRGKWMSENLSGKNNPAWEGGISFGKYCPKFNNQLKTKIRNKYNNCDYISGIHKNICSPKRNLDIHHVNYDKQCGCDGSQCELIPLCQRNHIKTNYNRFFWNKLFIYSLEIDKWYYEVE